jgi:hypothetical protein
MTSWSIACGITGALSSARQAPRTIIKCLSVFMLKSPFTSFSRDRRKVCWYALLMAFMSALLRPSRTSFKTFSFVPGPPIADCSRCTSLRSGPLTIDTSPISKYLPVSDLMSFSRLRLNSREYASLIASAWSGSLVARARMRALSSVPSPFIACRKALASGSAFHGIICGGP